jgi:acyl dehydratase
LKPATHRIRTEPDPPQRERDPMAAKFYEEFQVGDEFVTTGRTIAESDILQFAQLTGDWNQLHTDEEYAKGMPFGRRIAHGLLGLALMEGMKYRMGHFDGTAIASLSWTVKFARPIFIGDTVRVRARITAMRETRQADRGILTEAVELLNQHDEVVTEAEHLVMMRRRPG